MTAIARLSSTFPPRLSVVVWMSVIACCVPQTAGNQIDFTRDVAPLLAEACFQCHGPDAEARQAGLRLDLRDGALAQLDSGERAIVPGNVAASELIARIESTDPDLRMPPVDARRVLKVEEIDLLRQWVGAGAAYQTHWSFEPLRFQLPSVERRAWGNNPIDRFVVARLEAAGLTPAPRADGRTEIRRLYLDLWGLPPSPEEVADYVASETDAAYQAAVDRLLASPRYGERWGRHWLDVARYGDSNGGDENHAYPHAYRYRDYVIKALNDDLPYDRFIAEQLAGDLLKDEEFPDRAGEKIVGSGFLAIGLKIQAEQDPVKKRADMVDEQLDTIGKAFLGLTIACARCHDHKFDPISQREYYALAGILHSTDVAEVEVVTPEQKATAEQHKQEVQSLRVELAEFNQAWQRVLAAGDALLLEAEDFHRGNVWVDRERYGEDIGIISDPGAQDNFAEYDVELTKPGKYAIELRYAAEKSRPGKIAIDGEEIADSAISQTTGSWTPETQMWFREAIVTLEAGKHTLRISSKPLMSHIDKLRFTRLEGKNVAQLVEQEEAARKKLAELVASAPRFPVMTVAEGSVGDIQLHRRGNHLDLGEMVPRDTLRAVGSPGESTIGERQSGRLELAAWLTAPEGARALTARVIANRLWQGHFGRGLADSPNNFGTMGARPSHPELIDFLAQYLIDADWSLKALHRLIVTSETYRMASQHFDSKAAEVDPGNELLWRRTPRRLEAEAIRDALLAVSGQLELQMGGPPPQVKSSDPSGADLDNNQKQYEKSRRRSVYLPIVRSNVYDFLTLLDFPNVSASVGKRAVTTVPTQALLLMNNPVLVEHAERLAVQSREGTDGADAPTRIRRLYERLFARAPRDVEIAAAKDFLSAYAASLQPELGSNQGLPSDDEGTSPRRTDASAEAESEAWTAYCQTLLMSHEFVYVR